MYLGAHESAAGGPETAVERALNDECEALQIFVKNQRQWSQRMWTGEEAKTFREAYADSGLNGLVAHAAYLINLCSKSDSTVEKSIDALEDELTRCALLGVPYLVMHPGSHTGQGVETGIELICENLERVYAREEDDEWSDVTLLFENTAGQGTSIGWQFEHLAALFEKVHAPERFGVCYDTCHGHAGGYDLTTEDSYARVWDEFDALIGLERIKAFHLNDSRHELGSRKDRHEHIGEGEIGPDAFARLVNDERFDDIPALLETPDLENGERGYAENLERLRSLRSQ